MATDYKTPDLRSQFQDRMRTLRPDGQTGGGVDPQLLQAALQHFPWLMRLNWSGRHPGATGGPGAPSGQPQPPSSPPPSGVGGPSDRPPGWDQGSAWWKTGPDAKPPGMGGAEKPPMGGPPAPAVPPGGSAPAAAAPNPQGPPPGPPGGPPGQPEQPGSQGMGARQWLGDTPWMLAQQKLGALGSLLSRAPGGFPGGK